MTQPPVESPFANKVIFVLATNRSGTTWLVQLLAAHPDIAAFDAESMVISGLWNLWENQRRPDGVGISAYLSPEEFAAAGRTFCDQIFLSALDRYELSTSWFVEKSPPHSHLLPLAAVTHPDAWYIEIVRDGRDVAKSISESPFGDETLAATAQQWAKAIQDIRRDAWKFERFRSVRYEDLFADPVGQMTDIFGWLGLEVDDEVHQALEEFAVREVSRYKTGSRVGPGKWRDLPPADIRDIQFAADDILAECGYTD